MVGSGRKPDVESSTTQLILKAKRGEEEKIRWFKEWCWRNGKTISDILMEKVDETARLHGYPNGHSQAILDYAEKPNLLPLYMTCKYGSKMLVNGEFTCSQDKISRTEFICNLRNRNGRCYREIKK